MRVDVEDFERRYSQADDPWGFESLHYERRKYGVTVASLPQARYRRCFEPGCSIGVLTEQLAGVADEVVAMDASATAIGRARQRLAGRGGVRLTVGVLPEDWPSGVFDLVVLSELGYYWDEAGLRDVIDRTEQSIEPGGHLLAVHWLGSSSDHLLDGATVHRTIRERCGAPIVHHDDEQFVLDIWVRP